ncbi:MAG TPA: phosphotransferase [Candidatus Kapabacteria bacterium]|nr:phosphotransferase [Candidatus Kapabacteria bacterium]
MLDDRQHARVADLAALAAERWGCGDCALEHIADSGNSVWRVAGDGGQWILRLTNPDYRSLEENQAEVTYIRHLDACGVRAAQPVPSESGRWVENVSCDGAMLYASLFDYAPGELVLRDSNLWGEDFVRAWGHALGAMHAASRRFGLAAGGRWEWDREVFFAKARTLIPSGETDVLEELEELMAQTRRLARTPDNFGMVHGDVAPQNFRYDPALGITMFDFGNCCYHWYASDVAVSLSVLRMRPLEERNRHRSWLLAGYLGARPAAEPELRMVPHFLRLRILYVYLSRLFKFGPAPKPEEQHVLDTLRELVLARFDWDAEP